MPKQTRRAAPNRTERLDSCQSVCSECGASRRQVYTKKRTLVTLTGVLRLHLTIRACNRRDCRLFHRPYHPEAEGRFALPHHEFGLDVIAQIGNWRYRDHRSVPEIRARLLERSVPICERSVTHLLDRYDELLALTLLDQARLRAITKPHGRVILALDGIQPDVGHEVLWVLRDCLSGEILLARSLLSATEPDLAALLVEVQSALEVPIAAVLSDGQQSIRKAVATALPGVPHQLCHYHYLREAASPLFEADRHAKKELKKRVRGIRPLERAVSGQDHDAGCVVRGYALAIRSALSDDGQAPLDTPGLRLHERVSQIAESLQRVEEKGGSRPSLSG
jgi:hypothetical protein